VGSGLACWNLIWLGPLVASQIPVPESLRRWKRLSRCWRLAEGPAKTQSYLARSTHALKGLRQDKSADHLLRTVLLHVGCGYSLRETVVRAREAGLADLSDVALLKRFKQIAALGHLPKYDDQSSRAWLYGKLLVALLTEKLVQQANSFSPWGYELAPAAKAQLMA
jgi:hypothetical protein